MNDIPLIDMDLNNINLAALCKDALNERHYAVHSDTSRKIVTKQYDYQLYPGKLRGQLLKSGPSQLMIIPIGDFDKPHDYWVIPHEHLKTLLVPDNLTQGEGRTGKPRIRRWRFHIENQRFVLFPGDHPRLEIDVHQFYGANLPLPLAHDAMLDP